MSRAYGSSLGERRIHLPEESLRASFSTVPKAHLLHFHHPRPLCLSFVGWHIRFSLHFHHNRPSLTNPAGDEQAEHRSCSSLHDRFTRCVCRQRRGEIYWHWGGIPWHKWHDGPWRNWPLDQRWWQCGRLKTTKHCLVWHQTTKRYDSRKRSKPKGAETQGTRHTRNESATNRREAAKSSAKESTYARNARNARNANREECDGQKGGDSTEEDGTKEEFSVHVREVGIWVVPWVVAGQVKVMDRWISRTTAPISIWFRRLLDGEVRDVVPFCYWEGACSIYGGSIRTGYWGHFWVGTSGYRNIPWNPLG